MSHRHDHHDHAHGHAHAAARDDDGVASSMLMHGAASRIGGAVAALALLWAAVAWALSDLAT
ncbi:hypothetical protein [uncultured Piscinibacter sp.]|uniref:hypothetical protein n=1 Tax=uncultured Piscinibacter sp. TaxID=1131835 RepID=UPI002637C1F8|nr:hypothetical protein [uncultured Piscinibacter sp.]